MDNFWKEFESIKAAYYSQNPFRALVERKEVFAKGPLVLYGCGVLCRAVTLVCKDFDIKITAVCDTKRTGIHSDTGLEIISPECLANKYPDANVIICSYRYANEIKNKLSSLGFSDTQIYQSTYSMTSFIHPSDFIRNHVEGYEWAYNFFTDDISKKLVIDRIRMYLTGKELSKSSNNTIYFEDEVISLGENEVFVDGGAFIGDTAEEFIRQCKTSNDGKYGHIYSFEPDDAAREKAIKNLEFCENVEIVSKGLWSSDTELKFFSDGGNASSSFVIGVCDISLPVTSIDSFFTGKADDELPTYIKMDIEGAEKEALLGAINIIKKKHPKLAICVYHKPEDIYELTKLINEIDTSYKFTLRQYLDGIHDTVLYAI